MAGTTLSTLDPFSSPKPRESNPLGGMGYLNDNFETPERNASVPELRSLPEHQILGSIPFNKMAESVEKVSETVGSVVADTTEAASELVRYIFGQAPEAAGSRQISQPIYGEGNPELVQAQTESINQEAAAKEQQQLESWLKGISETQSIEKYKQQLAASIRLTGREVSYEEAKTQGYLDKTAIATLAGIARRDQEQAALADKQAENAAISSPAKKEASALQAAVEGASGNVNLELQNGPKVNLSAASGGPG